MLHNLPDSYTPPAEDKSDIPVAILVCHGMGQQVPFATLASIADRLSPDLYPPHTVRHIRFEDPDNPRRTLWLPRAEIEVANPQHPNAKKRKVHVYEAYWAPLAEGHIALTDVGRFLGVAGMNGLLLTFRPFLRWLFGKDYKFKIPFSTPIGLTGALLLIVALAAINMVITLVAAQNLLGTAFLSLTSNKLVDQLTADLGCLLLAGIVAGLTLWLSAKYRHSPARPILNALAWVVLTSACVALIGGAVLIVWHYFRLRVTDIPTTLTLSHGWRRQGIITLVWAGALGASWWLRNFFVQYLGDVALYVDAYKVDKYHKVREQIRRQAYRTACALYGAREQDTSGQGQVKPPFLYERIILVGHSLGSVIAYDALNATLNLDETLTQQLAVKQRTGALITFGSPLDKTAFIFHAQLPKNSLRAALGASVHPLIREVSARQAIPWVNIHSAADIISGALGFYDYPYSTANWKVQNLVDPDACTPVAAHNQYWNNNLVADTIRNAIFATHLPPASVAKAAIIPTHK
ncbi:hypothetical protein GCM10027422_47580 [Hymenobacter arcticus]